MQTQIKLQRKCPVCQNDTATTIHTQNFFVLSNCKLPNKLNIVECTNCSFVFSDTNASKEDYDSYYSTSGKYAFKQDFSPWEQQQANRLACLVQSNTTQEKKILEIGSGNACLMYSLARAGYAKLFAVDPNYDDDSTVKEFAVRRGHFGAIPYTNKETFDLIILSHVAEHVYDLEAMMAEIKTLVSPGGSILIEVPNGKNYHEHIESPFQDFNLEHINHFSPNSLTNLLGINGFEIQSLNETTIPIGEKRFYPAITGLFKFMSNANFEINPHSNRIEFESYVDKSNAYMTHIKTSMNTALADVKEIIIWGVGQLFYKLVEDNIIPKHKIIALVDSSFTEPQLDTTSQLRMIPPTMLHEISSPILICSTISKDPISLCIKNLGLNNQIITLPDYSKLATEPTHNLTNSCII